jgi:hypothetical protein
MHQEGTGSDINGEPTRYLPGRTEESHRKPPSEQPMFRSGFELRTSRMRVCSVAVRTTGSVKSRIKKVI